VDFWTSIQARTGRLAGWGFRHTPSLGLLGAWWSTKARFLDGRKY